MTTTTGTTTAEALHQLADLMVAADLPTPNLITLCDRLPGRFLIDIPAKDWHQWVHALGSPDYEMNPGVLPGEVVYTATRGVWQNIRVQLVATRGAA